MKKIVLLILLVLLVSPSYAEQNELADLTFMTENYPPANYIENGQLKGASVEVLKLIWKQLGIPEQPIQLVPWPRGYDLVQKRKNHVLFSMSRSSSREKLFKWVGPIFVSQHILVGLANNPLPIEKIEDAKQYKIGAIHNDISEISLLELGFPRENIDSRSNIESNILKLVNGRLDLICQSHESYRELSAKYGHDLAEFKVYGVVNTRFNHFAFNRETDDRVVAAYQQALQAIDEQRRQIVKKYGMVP